MSLRQFKLWILKEGGESPKTAALLRQPLTVTDSLDGCTTIVLSVPPSGKCCVTNLYVDPETGKLVVEYDNVPK